MVKLTGPMSSAQASGSLGRATTFSSWKGRAYARAKVVPANPKSELQVSVRAMLGFLSQQWATTSTAQKATWDVQALFSQISPYSAYISANLARWREFQAPTKTFPATESGTQPELDDWGAVGHVHHATITLNFLTFSDHWGTLLFRSRTTGFTPSRANCVSILPPTAIYTQNYDDTNLPPGIYKYRIATFTDTGKLLLIAYQASATVT